MAEQMVFDADQVTAEVAGGHREIGSATSWKTQGHQDDVTRVRNRR